MDIIRNFLTDKQLSKTELKIKEKNKLFFQKIAIVHIGIHADYKGYTCIDRKTRKLHFKSLTTQLSDDIEEIILIPFCIPSQLWYTYYIPIKTKIQDYVRKLQSKIYKDELNLNTTSDFLTKIIYNYERNILPDIHTNPNFPINIHINKSKNKQIPNKQFSFQPLHYQERILKKLIYNQVYVILYLNETFQIIPVFKYNDIKKYVSNVKLTFKKLMDIVKDKIKEYNKDINQFIILDLSCSNFKDYFNKEDFEPSPDNFKIIESTFRNSRCDENCRKQLLEEYIFPIEGGRWRTRRTHKRKKRKTIKRKNVKK